MSTSLNEGYPKDSGTSTARDVILLELAAVNVVETRPIRIESSAKRAMQILRAALAQHFHRDMLTQSAHFRIMDCRSDPNQLHGTGMPRPPSRLPTCQRYGANQKGNITTG